MQNIRRDLAAASPICRSDLSPVLCPELGVKHADKLRICRNSHQNQDRADQVAPFLPGVGNSVPS